MVLHVPHHDGKLLRQKGDGLRAIVSGGSDVGWAQDHVCTSGPARAGLTRARRGETKAHVGEVGELSVRMIWLAGCGRLRRQDSRLDRRTLAGLVADEL